MSTWRGTLFRFDSATSKYVFERLSWSRVSSLIFVVSIPRLLVAVLLCYYGTHYLLGTTSTEDLILNAMALEVVLNIDELVYAALSPPMVKKLLADTEPLVMPPGNKKRMRIIPMMRIVFILGMLRLIYDVEVLPRLQTMQHII